MLALQAIWRFWRQQNDAARLCVATALGAFLVDGVGAIANLIVPHSTSTGGLSAVALFYLILAMGSITWKSPETPRELAVQWRLPETLPVFTNDKTTSKSRDDQ